MFCLEDNIRKNHNIIVEDRKKFTFTGVKDVLSFDDQTIMLETVLGRLALKGEDLHLDQFDTEKGDICGNGKIHALIYTATDSNQGFFSRVFK